MFGHVEKSLLVELSSVVSSMRQYRLRMDTDSVAYVAETIDGSRIKPVSYDDDIELPRGGCIPDPSTFQWQRGSDIDAAFQRGKVSKAIL